MARNFLFDLLSKKFQFKFKDRIAAAQILAEALKDRIRNEEERKKAIILGIPRGGVVTADIVSNKLLSPFFDIIIPRRLTNPDNKEQAIGAITEDGTTYINYKLVSNLQITSKYLEAEKLEQMQEIKRRSTLYRKCQRNNFIPALKNRTVIIVDDGAATGATIIAATRWMKKVGGQPGRLIIAVPIAPRSTLAILTKVCDAELEVVISPHSVFRSVEQYHRNFEPISDEKVISIMNHRNHLPP